ncbi:MAG: class I SAM-dependent methyltransferase [Christensenellaceae bacterium]|jgi:23S rRNA (cytosine1962-C5)-methyltransferase|nr:class I SAM-dependent methyltransferase [Christensenellaceae bacterium]
MILTNNEWKNYRLIASGNGKKLENFNGVVLLRPDPEVIWDAPFDLAEDNGLSAIFDNEWQLLKPVPNNFFISWRNLKFNLKLMSFKHVGVFPEQSANWDAVIKKIKGAERPVNVLNLFAYTGGATLASIAGGASVTHVDAAKAMCARAGENIKSSQFAPNAARFIVDDCRKFIEREIKRGKKYDAVILDPPAYGRGANGELWKLEDEIFSLIKSVNEVLSNEPLFVLLNGYASGITPNAMLNVLKCGINKPYKTADAYETGIEAEFGGTILPAGGSAVLDF